MWKQVRVAAGDLGEKVVARPAKGFWGKVLYSLGTPPVEEVCFCHAQPDRIWEITAVVFSCADLVAGMRDQTNHLHPRKQIKTRRNKNKPE